MNLTEIRFLVLVLVFFFKKLSFPNTAFSPGDLFQHSQLTLGISGSSTIWTEALVEDNLPHADALDRGLSSVGLDHTRAPWHLLMCCHIPVVKTTITMNVSIHFIQ